MVSVNRGQLMLVSDDSFTAADLTSEVEKCTTTMHSITICVKFEPILNDTLRRLDWTNHIVTI